MEDYESNTETHIGISFIALIVGVIVFILVWVVGGIVFNLFDGLRGLGNDKLQAVFRELFVPGVGGYLAMASTNSWFEKASIKFVFFCFAAVILVFVGAYIGSVGPIVNNIGGGIWGFILSIISIISALAGAYIYVKDEL